MLASMITSQNEIKGKESIGFDLKEIEAMIARSHNSSGDRNSRNRRRPRSHSGGGRRDDRGGGRRDDRGGNFNRNRDKRSSNQNTQRSNKPKSDKRG